MNKSKVKLPFGNPTGLNQCDGCLAGHTLDSNGHHTYQGKGYMVCQKYRYNDLEKKKPNV